MLSGVIQGASISQWWDGYRKDRIRAGGASARIMSAACESHRGIEPALPITRAAGVETYLRELKRLVMSISAKRADGISDGVMRFAL